MLVACLALVVRVLELLQQRSTRRFGRTIHVIAEPQQRMMGDLVAEVVLLRATDGVQIELLRRAARLPQSLEPDWT